MVGSEAGLWLVGGGPVGGKAGNLETVGKGTGPRGVERDSEGLVTSVPLETLATHPATKGKGNVGRDRSLSSFIPVPSTPNRRQESKVLVGWIGLSARTSPHSLCSFAASHSVALERVYYPTSVTMEGRGSHMTTSFIT